jgi:hypothetical protein
MSEAQWVYLAYRDGIQSRAVIGLFSTEDAARAACEDATDIKHKPDGNARTWDGDGWHTFTVERMQVDSGIPWMFEEMGVWQVPCGAVSRTAYKWSPRREW